MSAARLAALWTTVRAGGPGALVPVVPGQRNFPGLYYAATMDAHVGFESWAERDVAMMLDFSFTQELKRTVAPSTGRSLEGRGTRCTDGS